jgi:hypothetical protein
LIDCFVNIPMARYAVWSSERCDDVRVLAVFGGQSVEEGGFLTSMHFWKFCCEYAKVLEIFHFFIFQSFFL